LKVNHPIKPISPIKITHDKKLDHEKMICMMKRKVKRRDDCHAWNLHDISDHISKIDAESKSESAHSLVPGEDRM
jgi:hypothetical protein